MRRRRQKVGRQGILPFVMRECKQRESVTAWGGLPLVVEASRALGVDDAARAHLPQPKRKGGFTPSEKLETLITLIAAGGDRVEDIRILDEDKGLAAMLDTPLPSPDALLAFLHQFHDQSTLDERPEEKAAFVPRESAALAGLAEVNRVLVHRGADSAATTATIDLDGTIIESHNSSAKMAYEGTKGYQPLVALWAEQQMIVADEFRDGNVPGALDPLSCAQRAFDALPANIKERYFRADSACYHQALIRYLVTQNIRFSISADMTKQLRDACLSLPETEWKTAETRAFETVEWADVEYVPGNVPKDWSPLRYVAIRITRRQGDLFIEDARKFLAVVTNRRDLDGKDLLSWHWQKAGTVEHAHRTLKNDLAAGVMPSSSFGTNAAWFRINVITFNLLAALKQRALPERLRHARPKRLRFEILNLPGKVVFHQKQLTLSISASAARLRELVSAREYFRTRYVRARAENRLQ